MRLYLLLLTLVYLVIAVECLVHHNFRIPISSGIPNRAIRDQWRHVIDSLEFFEAEHSQRPIGGNLCYVAPLLDAKVDFRPSDIAISEFLLSVEAVNEEDMIFICTKLHTILKQIDGISSLYHLRKVVAAYYNKLPPSPGYDASLKSNLELVDEIFKNKRTEIMHQLQHDGFVVVDSNVKTSISDVERLSELLVEKTGQNKSIRTDTVAFITEQEAKKYGVSQQYDLLLSITSYLNEYLEFEESNYEPLPPATERRPLTNPNEIQIAEYIEGEFYIEHSDNSLMKASEGNERSNYRCYTCILYCNDNWDCSVDGGALRLYRNSIDVTEALDAIDTCNYIDINPSNGVLLIFDSRLIHSVQRVTSAEKKRIAFTLWTLRPESRRCIGEVYDSGQEVESVQL